MGVGVAYPVFLLHAQETDTEASVWKALYCTTVGQENERCRTARPIPDIGTPVALEVAEPRSVTGQAAALPTRGLRLIPGPVGPRGSKGERGEKGSKGRDGTDGTDGTDGATGPQGSSGTDGATGPQGPQGNSGPATSFTVSADSGADQTISNGTVLDFSGGSGLSTAASTNALSFALTNWD